jgi:uroporphyrinogen-III decarboxylase
VGDRKTTLMGNVRTSLFSEGTRDEMEADIRRCIHEAAGRGRFILASGCEIPVNATEDRTDHYFDYARGYGRTFLSRLREEAPDRFS